MGEATDPEPRHLLHNGLVRGVVFLSCLVATVACVRLVVHIGSPSSLFEALLLILFVIMSFFCAYFTLGTLFPSILPKRAHSDTFAESQDHSCPYCHARVDRPGDKCPNCGANAH
jgi:apolipoprotein N-acyltransferase